MRKVAVLMVALVAAVSLAAPAMAAGDPLKTLTRKVTALEKQVKALRADLAETRGRVAAVETTTDCLGPVVPISQFGGVFNGVPEGYLYGIGQTVYMTTGLDLVADTTGLVPGEDYGLMMTWAGSCASDPPAVARRSLGAVQRTDTSRAVARLGSYH
jgi:hypothetical protein